MIRKKVFAVLLSVVMITGMIPPLGIAADTPQYEPVFIAQPQSVINISTDTLTYHVAWNTNYMPSRVRVMAEEIGGVGLPEEVALLSPTTTGQYDFPSTASTGNKYYIETYYSDPSDPETERRICSNYFMLSHDNLVFAAQPHDVLLNTSTLTWTVNWTLNFTPTAIEIMRDVYESPYFPDEVYMTLSEGLDVSGSFPFGYYGTPRNKPFYLRAYFGDGFYIESETFMLTLPDGIFTEQPVQNPPYDIQSNTYTVYWSTNFIPTAAYLVREGYEITGGYEVSDLGMHMSMRISGHSGSDYRIKLVGPGPDYNTVLSEPFVLDNSSLGFTVQPAEVITVRPEDLQYVITWQTNFYPVKFEVFRANSTGPDTCLATVTDNLNRYDLAHVLYASDVTTQYSYYIEAYYNETGKVRSNYFRLSYDSVGFLAQPYDVSLDPDSLKASTTWTTNFQPSKVEVVMNQYGSDWSNYPIETYTSPGDSFFHTFDANYSTMHTYYLRAYINSREYILSDEISLSKENIKFIQQPTLAHDLTDDTWTVSWETSFVPVRAFVRCDDEEFSYLGRDSIVAELTENLGKTGSYTFETEPDSEHDYYLDVYYGTYDIISDYFGRSGFTSLPQNGYAISGALTYPFIANWETNYPPTSVEVWTYDKYGNPSRFSTLSAGTTSYEIDYDQASESPLMKWFFRAYFGEEHIDTPDIFVQPLLILESDTSFNMKTYPGSHAFHKTEADAERDTILNSNFNDTSSFHYDFSIPAEEYVNITLWIRNNNSYDEESDMCLYASYYRDIEAGGEPETIFNGLDQSILNVLPSTGSPYGFEISTSMQALRTAFNNTSNPDKDVFDIIMTVSSDIAYFEFILRDNHVPAVDWEDYLRDNYDLFKDLTLTEKAFDPSVIFPDDGRVDSVKADWYAVVGTESESFEYNGQYYEPDSTPFEPIPLHPIPGDENYWAACAMGIGDEYYDSIADRFYRYFGDGYNCFAEGVANPAPRGPEKFIYGIAANKLTVEGPSFHDVKVSLSDFINSSNLEYFNSLPGLDNEFGIGYYVDGEESEVIPPYNLRAIIGCVLKVTYKDGLVKRFEFIYLKGLEDGHLFNVVGDTVSPQTKTVSFYPGDEGAGGEMETRTVLLNETYALPECGFEDPAGKTFSYWSVRIGNNDPVDKLPGDKITVADDTSVTAVWADFSIPAFKTQSLILSGQIGLIFYMDLDCLTEEQRAGSYMEFSISGKNGGTHTAPFNAGRKNRGKTYYGFTCPTTSIQMADTITATYHYKDSEGIDQTVSKEYSVERYLQYFDASSGTELFDLIRAINDYGYHAQNYLSSNALVPWNYGTDHKAMSSVYNNNYGYVYGQSDLEAYKLTKVLNSDIESLSCSLTLDSDTAVNLYVTPDPAYAGSVNAKLSDGTSLEVIPTDNRYKIIIPGIAAHMLGNMYEVEIITQSGVSTVNVSALSYAYATIENEETSNIMGALYNYYLKTVAYRNAQDG